MIKCTNPECGAENEDGAKFCAECGAPFSNELICPDCGAKCEPGTRFCGECGHPFEEAGESESVEEAEEVESVEESEEEVAEEEESEDEEEEESEEESEEEESEEEEEESEEESEDEDAMINRLSDMLNDITEGNVYGDGNIPDKKLTNAVAAYGNGLITKDEVLLLVDDTVFGSAKEGCMASGQFFISKATMEQPLYVRLKKGMKFEACEENKIVCSGRVVCEMPTVEKRLLKRIAKVLTLLSKLA